MSLVLRLYDGEGSEVGTASYFQQSFSVDMVTPNAEALRDALADRDEFGGFIRPSDDEDFGEVAVPIKDPEVALDRVGSAMVTSGLVDSYRLTDDK